jgi:hypothetical protein
MMAIGFPYGVYKFQRFSVRSCDDVYRLRTRMESSCNWTFSTDEKIFLARPTVTWAEREFAGLLARCE